MCLYLSTSVSLFLFVCFVLRHINLIGHLMPNQVKENKSEKKFKGINDKLYIIIWLFAFFIWSLFVGNHYHKEKL